MGSILVDSEVILERFGERSGAIFVVGAFESLIFQIGILRGLRVRYWSLRGWFWEPPGSILEHFRADLRSICG